MILAAKAAKTLCEISGWTLTNLQVQKILYIAHRTFLGRHKRGLIDENFEAWDYGPVIPSVYKECRGHGNSPVRYAFLLNKPFNEGSPERMVLEEVYGALKDVSPGRLVAMTHIREGAWWRSYKQGLRGQIISQEAILNEYNELLAKHRNSSSR